MNEHKISFIICSNRENYLQECRQYIAELYVPEGFSIEVLPITGAASMTAGYQQGMLSTDARYKIYMHQDVFILNRNFIQDSLDIFEKDKKIGMIGMVGTKQLPENGCMWTTPMRTGALRSSVLNTLTVDSYFDLPVNSSKGYAPVQAIDGLLMMTRFDLPWQEKLDFGWDFYDVSQSIEFTRQGYHIAVPYQKKPWVLHDTGFLHLNNYNQARKIFLSTYFPERQSQIADCDREAQMINEKQIFLSNVQPIKSQVLSLFMKEDYEQAIKILQKYTKQYQKEEDFFLLCIIANILEKELHAGTKNILNSFCAAENKFTNTKETQTASPESYMASIWKHYRQIRFCLWRLKYLSSVKCRQEAKDTLLEYDLSEIALTYFKELTGCTDIGDSI